MVGVEVSAPRSCQRRSHRVSDQRRDDLTAIHLAAPTIGQPAAFLTERNRVSIVTIPPDARNPHSIHMLVDVCPVVRQRRRDSLEEEYV